MKVDECISYTINVVNQFQNLSTQKKEHFLKQIRSIQKRADNAYLHVALIGDFSAGKSTFINALVKQNILKTAWQATTAIPTYIYYHDNRSQSQEQTQIVVETSDGVRYRLYNAEHCSQLEKKLDIQLPTDARDIIALLSASNTFVDKIKRIGVRISSCEGLRHVCIIDTPGVNPGTEEARLHVMKTQEVLRNYADATIVLFQETQVFTASFKKFLEENAGHFMNDAIFVITMMDLAEEEKREGLLEYVRLQLKQTFGIESPVVYGCCAKAVVSGRTDSESRYWVDAFDRMRDQIIQYMADQQKRIINRQMASLLESLISELDAEVTVNLCAVEQRREQLESRPPANTTERYEQYREYLFTKEKMEIQIKRYDAMHRKLSEYHDKLQERDGNQ